MEKKTYFSPIMKIHTLALHCVMQTISGGGTGDENAEGEAKSSYNSFLDWDDNIEE